MKQGISFDSPKTIHVERQWDILQPKIQELLILKG